MQVGQALLVQAAHRVDECLGQRQARAHPQAGRPGRVGERGRRCAGSAMPGSVAPAAMAAVPGLDDGLDRAVGRRPRRRRAAARAGPPRPRRPGATPSSSSSSAANAAYCRSAACVVAGRAGTAGSAAPGGSRRAGSSPPRARRSRGPGRARRGPAGPSAASCSTASAADASRRRSESSHDSKAGAPRTTGPSSSSPPRPATSTASAQAPCEQHGDVDAARRRRAVSTTGSPSMRAVVAQRPADLGQAPAQRPQRVVGLGEEQLGQPAPAGGPLGEQQVRQQRPALAAAQPVGLGVRCRSRQGRPSSRTTRRAAAAGRPWSGDRSVMRSGWHRPGRAAGAPPGRARGARDVGTGVRCAR